MSTQSIYRVAPPEPNEKCDFLCPAVALVSVRLKSGRLVFCAHHFDQADTEFCMDFLSVNDTRKEEE